MIFDYLLGIFNDFANVIFTYVSDQFRNIPRTFEDYRRTSKDVSNKAFKISLPLSYLKSLHSCMVMVTDHYHGNGPYLKSQLNNSQLENSVTLKNRLA